MNNNNKYNNNKKEHVTVPRQRQTSGRVQSEHDLEENGGGESQEARRVKGKKDQHSQSGWIV